MKISIKDVKDMRERLDATHLVVFSVDEDGTQHVATHGCSPNHAKEAAEAGNNLKAYLGWPDHLCRETPLERKCCNCAFYQAYRYSDCGIRDGGCCVEPKEIRVESQRIACQRFVPNR